MALLQPLLGIFVLLTIAWLMSERRTAVRPGQIAIGIAMQFLLAGLFFTVPLFADLFLFVNKIMLQLADATEATHTLVVRHADRVGVLASVLDALREEGINVQEMQNVLFRGGDAACARINVVGEPTPETLTRLSSGEHVYDVSVGPLER